VSKRVWILGSVAVVLTAAAVFVQTQIGFSNLIGILRYDTRREGDLKVGDPAPSVLLHEIENGAPTRILERPPDRPVILVFGSFT